MSVGAEAGPIEYRFGVYNRINVAITSVAIDSALGLQYRCRGASSSVGYLKDAEFFANRPPLAGEMLSIHVPISALTLPSPSVLHAPSRQFHVDLALTQFLGNAPRSAKSN